MWRYYPSLMKVEIDRMELEEYHTRITSALMREGDKMNIEAHNALWVRLASMYDEKGRYLINSMTELFNHEAYLRLLKGEAIASTGNKAQELEEKLSRAEWVRQEAKRIVAERRKMNAN